MFLSMLTAAQKIDMSTSSAYAELNIECTYYEVNYSGIQSLSLSVIEHCKLLMRPVLDLAPSFMRQCCLVAV